MNRKRRQLIWIGVAVLLSTPASAQPQDRTSVIHSLVVEQGQQVGDITCYFCPVRVVGEAQGDVTTIGADVEVDGAVSGDVVAVGGDVKLRPKARVLGEAVAVGGVAHKDPRATTRNNNAPVSVPWFFLPGQRSFAWRGVAALIGFFAMLALFFAALLRGRRLERFDESMRRWYLTVPLGIVLLAGLSLGFNFADHFGRWADRVDYGLAAILLILLGAGFAGLAYTVGGWFLPRTTAASVSIGAAVLIALLLIPVAGFVVFLSVLVLALGGAAWNGLGFRGGRRPALRPYPPRSPRPTGRGPLDLLPR